MKVASKPGSTVRIECTHCQSILRVRNEHRGKPVVCNGCSNYLVVPKGRFEPQMVFDDFIVRRLLGRGNMGAVYLACQRSLDRMVALKILHKEFNGDNKLLNTLEKEAKVAARLNHPNIVQCYAVGDADGIFYYVMEYVQGKTLKHLLDKRWRLPAGQAVAVIRPVASALDYAWREVRLVHRDIKPENIILREDDGAPKLTDLGLARPAPELHRDQNADIQGTPPYICPEEVLGRPLDHRSDIYSLGCVLYHAITGVFPHDGETAEEIVVKHVKEELVTPLEHVPDLAPEVAAVVLKMMAKDPRDRYQDMTALLNDLDALPPLPTETQNTRREGVASELESTLVMEDPRAVRPQADRQPSAAAAAPPRGTSKALIGVLIALALLVIGGGGVGACMMMGDHAAETTPRHAAPLGESEASGPTMAPADLKAPVLVGLLVDPVGQDYGFENVILHNPYDEELVLDGFVLAELDGARMPLAGTVPAGQEITFTVPPKTIRLNNTGDTVQVLSPNGHLVQTITYTGEQVQEGAVLRLDGGP